MVKQLFKQDGLSINKFKCSQLLAMLLNIHEKCRVGIVATRLHYDISARSTTVTIKHKPRALQRVVLNQAIISTCRRDENPQLCWIIVSPF